MQKEIDYIKEIYDRFPNEQSCIDHLEWLRWNGKVVSPFDSSSVVYKCKDNKYRCKNTGKYFSVKTNTLFEDSKVPLRKWFAAIYLFDSLGHKISSVRLSNLLDITQKTAYYMKKKINNMQEWSSKELITKKSEERKAEKINFRDFDVRVWRDGDLSMHTKDMQCFISDTHIGVQTNTTDKDMNAMIEAVCGNIREDFKKLNELLNKIE